MSRSVCDEVVLVAQRAIVTLLRWLDALLNGRVIGVSATTTDACAAAWDLLRRYGSNGAAVHRDACSQARAYAGA